MDPSRVYFDHGLTGTTGTDPASARRSQPPAPVALVVAKLDRLARSLPDALDIADEPTDDEVKLNPGGSVHEGRLRGKKPELSDLEELFPIIPRTAHRAVARAGQQAT